MKIQIITSNFLENWDYDNPDGQGIGGSETSQIELAWRLARRGHEVTSYSPTAWDGERTWRGVRWTHYKNCDYTEPGLWLVYRSPSLLDNFPLKHPHQRIFQVCQDTYYPGETEARYAKIEKYICLCRDHAQYTEARLPFLKDKIVISQNGLRDDLVNEVLAEGIERKPNKIMFASSPDRGIKAAVAVVERAREYIHDLELHTYYGLDNYKSAAANKDNPIGAYFSQRMVADIEQYMAKHPWVIQHGRVSQQVLYREWASTTVWLYPTNFGETFCSSSTEAQALGAFPITNPYWGLRDNVQHGMLIEGDPTQDLLVRNRYTAELLRMMSTDGLKVLDAIRPQMMADAMRKYSWEVAADQMEQFAGVKSESETYAEAVA